MIVKVRYKKQQGEIQKFGAKIFVIFVAGYAQTEET